MECLFTRFNIRGQQIVAAMRDGAAVNGAALNHLRVFMPNMFDVVCFSHTLDNVGKHFNTPTLDAFGQHWVRLFSTSCQAKLRWKDQTGQMPKSFSDTRWWSRWEVYNQIFEYFGDVRQFLDNHQDISPKIMDHLRVLMDDDDRLCQLKLELAAVIDIGRHFVKATYDLEGDGALSLCCYDRLQAVANACRPHAMFLPNVHAVALDLAATFPNVAVDWAEGFGRQAVRDAVLWFHRKFNGELYTTVRAFKAARLMCPATITSLNPTADAIQQLRVFPFLDQDALMQGLLEELPLYLAAAEDVTFRYDTIGEAARKKVEFWRHHEDRLPNWAQAVRKVVLVQPSFGTAGVSFPCFRQLLGINSKMPWWITWNAR